MYKTNFSLLPLGVCGAVLVSDLNNTSVLVSYFGTKAMYRYMLANMTIFNIFFEGLGYGPLVLKFDK